MKAIVCERLGGLDHVRLTEVPEPPIEDGQVRVAIAAAGLNFPDLLMLEGAYQHKPEPPYVLGMECAGIVRESHSAAFTVGDRVMAGMKTGAFAEETVVDASSVSRLPDALSFEEGAAFRVGFQTAYISLVRFGRVEPGQTVLINGASGGVGMAAVILARYLGARIVATGGSAEKLKQVKAAGADTVIDLSWQNLRDTVLQLTDGAGADVLFDPVGGDVFHQSLRCLAYGGKALIIGFASGEIPEVAMGRFLIKGLQVIGIRAGEFGRRFPEEGAKDKAALMSLAEEGVLRPHISVRMPLERACDALRLMQERKVVGRAILING